MALSGQGSGLGRRIRVEATVTKSEGGLEFNSLVEFSTVCCNPQVRGFSAVNESKVAVFLEFS